MAVRLGFIGTGGVAQGHLQRLAGNADAELVAYCDVDLGRAQKAADEYGGQSYDGFRNMLDSEALDGLVICVPPFAHGDIEQEACQRGLAMLIEKPVAIDMEMALPILEAVEDSEVITLVAYKYRWDDHVIKAKQMLEDKTIGLVFGNFWGGTPGVSWWRVMSESGGQMVEQTTHIVDMVRYLCGEITDVQAFATKQVMHTVLPDFDIWDAVSANLQFASQAVGTISTTCMVHTWAESSLRVMAHDFTLRVSGNSLTWADKEGAGEYDNQVDGYQGEDDAFVAAVKTGDRSAIYSDYADATRSLAVTVAANKSVQSGGRAVSVCDLLS